MRETLYVNEKLALINYTKAYCTTLDELISSEPFEIYLNCFVNEYEKINNEMFLWLTRDKSIKETVVEFKIALQMLIALDINDINLELFKNRKKFEILVDEFYQYWRRLERYSVVVSSDAGGFLDSNFISADNNFNLLIRDFHRKIKEKVVGSKNNVYRQLRSGTNASFLVRNYKSKLPKGYQELEKVNFINAITVRTPLIIHTKSNKRIGTFVQASDNPIKDIDTNTHEWFCFPCKVGSLLTFVYFHRDFTGSVVALSNLFEIASDTECVGKKPDCIVLFGNKDNKNETTFFHDEQNDIWIGKVSYSEVIDYFGYVKKMCLTLHNLKIQSKGWLPLHGAMINVYLKDGSKKGIVFIGDSGAGKSETIEALANVTKHEIINYEIIFDDMGSMHIENGELVCQGTEIGAFVRLDDLDKGSAYKNMDLSIFFNPEGSNARVVIPTTAHSTVVTPHKIDMFIYANNYTDKRGLRRIMDIEKAKDVFITGKRFALGTTQEKGISTTFFANPFGPLQKKEQCIPIIDRMFEELYKHNVYVGELYTCLGLDDKGNDGLKAGAIDLFAQIKNII